MRDRIERLTENLSRTVVGKADAIRLVLVALLSGGHALLEDVPGVGKTLLAKSLARSIAGKFQRLQCTPDLLPTDVTGTNIWNPSSGEFQFLAGPAFTNVLLADEISPDTCRLWDQSESDPERRVMDKDRFRQDLGNVESAYQQVLQRIMAQTA